VAVPDPIRLNIPADIAGAVLLGLTYGHVELPSLRRGRGDPPVVVSGVTFTFQSPGPGNPATLTLSGGTDAERRRIANLYIAYRLRDNTRPITQMGGRRTTRSQKRTQRKGRKQTRHH
jgi:hypothetical protein